MLSVFFSLQTALCIFITGATLRSSRPCGKRHILLLSFSLFIQVKLCLMILNGFMVTHDVHFKTLLALGLKKKCGAGWENMPQREQGDNWPSTAVGNGMDERGSGGLHAEILSPLPISFFYVMETFWNHSPLYVTYFPLPVCGLSQGS